MDEQRLEKRACLRFRVHGATVRYKKERTFLKKSDYIAEFCPILDLSRGGIRFLTTERLKFGSEVKLRVSIPDEAIPLPLAGIVRWFTINPGQSYKYQIGIQFHPYGEKKGQNDPAVLKKIIELEGKFLEDAEALDEDIEIS